MGGRRGSRGRPAGLGRDIVEDRLSIDVNYLSREGCLGPGRTSIFRWRGNATTTEIALMHDRDQLHLSYLDDRRRLEQVIHIDRDPCRFGGERSYFMCPGRLCGRRVVKLYGAGLYFLCRHCCDLTYACQREQPWDRKARRAGKIRRRLGGEPGMYCPFPQKPPGMWWRTYDRLFAEESAAAAQAEAAIMQHSTQLG